MHWWHENKKIIDGYLKKFNYVGDNMSSNKLFSPKINELIKEIKCNNINAVKENSTIDELNANKIVFMKDDEDIEDEDEICSLVELENVKSEI